MTQFAIYRHSHASARRGKKRALIAIGHTILSLVSTLLARKAAYRALGAAYVEPLDERRVEQGLVRRLEHIGYRVS